MKKVSLKWGTVWRIFLFLGVRTGLCHKTLIRPPEDTTGLFGQIRPEALSRTTDFVFDMSMKARQCRAAANLLHSLKLQFQK